MKTQNLKPKAPVKVWVLLKLKRARSPARLFKLGKYWKAGDREMGLKNVFIKGSFK